MPPRRLLLLLSAALFLLSLPLCLYAGKRITIISPDSLASQYANETSLPLKPALFGPNLFGKTILGSASYYVDPGNPEGCNALHPNMTIPAGGWVSDEGIPMIPQILLLDRGTCNFVKKVYNAQNIGASAVIIVARQGEALTYMADDGTGSNIAIPAMIILYSDGQAIKQVLRTGQAVLLQLTWSPDEVVEVDFWTSSNDAASTALKESFGDVVSSFGASMNFTPHYQIYDFHTQCSQFPTECSKLCLGSGQYCALDPERDYTRGLRLRCSAREPLRRLCGELLKEHQQGGAVVPLCQPVSKSVFPQQCDMPCGGPGASWFACESDPGMLHELVGARGQRGWK